MPDAEQPEPPLTEPLFTPCLLVTGLHVEYLEGLVRFVGWVSMPQLGGETDERRINVRFGTTVPVARSLAQQIQQSLSSRR